MSENELRIEESDGYEEYLSITADQKAAEVMSLESYEHALNAYIDLGGGVFSSGKVEDPDLEYYVQCMTARIKTLTNGLLENKCPLELFEPDDADLAAKALTMPDAIHYIEYEYCDVDFDTHNPFAEEEQWATTDETEACEAFVKALHNFCLQAATLAKRLQSRKAQFFFSRAYIEIEESCMRRDHPESACTPKQANQVVRWMLEASRLLWCDTKIAENEKAVADREAHESPAGSGVSHKKNFEFKLGQYARKIVKSVNPETRTIVFFGSPREGDETLVIQQSSIKAWEIFCLVASSIASNGAAELPESLRPWRGHFRRRKKLSDGSYVDADPNLVALKKHLESCKGAGKRGLPVLRLR